MSPKVKKEKEQEVEVPADPIDAALAAHGLLDIVQLAADYNTQMVCHSTGYPGLDYICNPEHLGIARGIDIELFSDVGSAAKTTIALCIIRAFQAEGLRTLFIDIENAPGLEDYMQLLGIYTRQEDCPPGIYAVRIVRGRIDEKSGKVIPLTLEQSFDTLEVCAKEIFDLCVLDSVDALSEKAELDKEAGDNAKWGRISKKMSEFMRKMVVKRATIIWLNQTREGNGFSPTGTPPKKTSGGRAMLFYADLRIKLEMIKRLKEAGSEEDEAGAWGFITKATTVKNKTSSRGLWLSTELAYVFGEGVSRAYAYFQAALDKKLIVKSGSWMKSDFLGFNVQGTKAMYEAIRDNRDGAFDKLIKLFDGEDAEEEVVVEDDAADNQAA